MLVIGIDPGSVRTGYGIIREESGQPSLVTYGCVNLSTLKTFPEKLKIISKNLRDIIRKHEPDSIAIEDCFYSKNVKSALKLGHIRGAIILTAINEDLEIYEYSPLEIKKSVVGYGRAEKLQVQKMIQILLKMDEIPYPEDSADALACAYCHIASYKTKNLINIKKYR
jgi:crossover junction endodeoxyribonuclease RuvC